MNRSAAAGALSLIALTFFPACTRSRTSGTQGRGGAAGPVSPTPEGDDTDDTPDPPALLEAAVPAVPSGPWRDALRDERWGEAAALLDALPDETRKTAALRFARARTAAALSDFPTVVRLLVGLEAELPPLARRIALLRAEAQSVVGPFEEAAAYWSSNPFQGGARAALRAAQAYEKAGHPADARRALDRAIAMFKEKKGLAEARSMRARLAEASGVRDVAIADARWIVQEAPTSAYDRAARDLLGRLDPSFALSPSERLTRATRFAEAGKAEAALAELDAVPAGAPHVTTGEILHTRGNVLFKLRRWTEAAETLRRAASQGSPEPVADELAAARALSRADRDDEALAAYQALAASHPKTSFADEALYLSARLRWLLGRDREASPVYGKYLSAYPKGKHVRDARYELGLVQLTLKNFDQARLTFAALAGEADGTLEVARLRELEGVAALEGGDVKGAEQTWRAVIRAQPLSWPALVARARLADRGLPLPPALEPPDTLPPPTEPLAPAGPGAGGRLGERGLLTDAEDALRKDERVLQSASASRATEALCRAYATLERGGRRHRIAQEQIRAETLFRAPHDGNRWAWECFYPSPYPALITTAEKREAIPPGLLYALMRQESSFQPSVVSPAQAVGLLQLLPSTARSVAARAGLPFDEATLTQPPVNIDLGARYFARLRQTWHGNDILAVASYNGGPKAVSKWVQRWGHVPADIWVARIPYAETRTYVVRVFGNAAHYAYLAGGEAAIPVVPLTIDENLRAGEDAFLEKIVILINHRSLEEKQIKTIFLSCLAYFVRYRLAVQIIGCLVPAIFVAACTCGESFIPASPVPTPSSVTPWVPSSRVLPVGSGVPEPTPSSATPWGASERAVECKASELEAAVGKPIVLVGVQIRTKLPTVCGADVNGAYELSDKRVVVRGVVHKDVVTAVDPYSANRGTGTFYSIVDPETGRLATTSLAP